MKDEKDNLLTLHDSTLRLYQERKINYETALTTIVEAGGSASDMRIAIKFYWMSDAAADDPRPEIQAFRDPKKSDLQITDIDSKSAHH